MVCPNPDVTECGLLFSKYELRAMIKFKLCQFDFDAERGPSYYVKTYESVFTRVRPCNQSYICHCSMIDNSVPLYRK